MFPSRNHFKPPLHRANYYHHTTGYPLFGRDWSVGRICHQDTYQYWVSENPYFQNGRDLSGRPDF